MVFNSNYTHFINNQIINFTCVCILFANTVDVTSEKVITEDVKASFKITVLELAFNLDFFFISNELINILIDFYRYLQKIIPNPFKWKSYLFWIFYVPS